MAHLTVVAIVCEPHLGADHEDLAVQAENPAVEALVPVLHRHADVQQDAMAALVKEDPVQHLVTVQVQILLDEVIQTSITTYFQLL